MLQDVGVHIAILMPLPLSPEGWAHKHVHCECDTGDLPQGFSDAKQAVHPRSCIPSASHVLSVISGFLTVPNTVESYATVLLMDNKKKKSCRWAQLLSLNCHIYRTGLSLKTSHTPLELEVNRTQARQALTMAEHILASLCALQRWGEGHRGINRGKNILEWASIAPF